MAFAAHFYRAAVGFENDAIGDAYIFGNTAAKAENRPARAERAIGDGDKLAAAKQCAGIVLRLHVAVNNMNILTTDEMKAIVIMDHPAVDMDPVELYIAALNNPYRMVGTVLQKNIVNDKVLTLVKKQVVRAVIAGYAGW